MQLINLMKLIISMEQFFNFITNGIKTTVTSISSISLGLILDTTNSNNVIVDFTTKMLQNISLTLGSIVALFAIINGVFTLCDNLTKRINKHKLKKQRKCKLKPK